MQAMESKKRVALLATGDEIVNGDILNTNSQIMAQTLFDLGITVGMHLIVCDEQPQIENAIHYLLEHHDALIITGGLGPTSDDRTRFALSESLHLPLIFNEAAWRIIEERFARYGLKNQPASNRNQALFPEGAHIIANTQGSASGCFITQQDKIIFMLPGPPNECLPMFHEIVTPQLISHQFQTLMQQKKWLLFAVSEGAIAHELDKIAAPYDVTMGYRLRYPYVEVKARSQDPEKLNAFVDASYELLQPHIFNKDAKPASENLIEYLNTHGTKLYIDDQATRGTLAKTLTTLTTHEKLHFGQHQEMDGIIIRLNGMEEMAHETTATHVTLYLQVNDMEQSFSLPYRAQRTFLYAAELTCQQILIYLKAIPLP